MIDKFARVPLAQILIDREGRQRRQVLVEDLLPSIKARGVLVPIIIDEAYQLIAGERRLEASRQLGLPDIPVRFLGDLSPIEAQIIELEENLKRQDLDWKDTAGAIGKIHRLYIQQDPGWSMGETAQALGLTLGNVSMYLRVFGELEAAQAPAKTAEGEPAPVVSAASTRILEAGGAREAYNIIARRDQRAAGSALQELLEPLAQGAKTLADDGGPGEAPGQGQALLPPTDIILGSFLEWAPKYTGPKFNLVHCDFPYGTNVFNGPQGKGAEPSEGYSDDPEVYWNLLDGFCESLDKFFSLSGHILFWLSADHQVRERTLRVFAEKSPSLTFLPMPLIWLKSDNAGIVSDVRRRPRHVYENALLGYRGDRYLVRPMADAYSAPTDRALHPSTKPEPMLRHFFSMLVDEHTQMLDPTCGSGASLRAAESLGASRVLGLEIDPLHAENARMALETSRRLRASAKNLNEEK